VNGSSTGFFSSFRGSRQRDCLSLLLFVIMMEALGRIILTTVSVGLFYGFSVRIGNDISHFFVCG
jgi:hypothetical protein